MEDGLRGFARGMKDGPPGRCFLIGLIFPGGIIFSRGWVKWLF